MRHYRRKFILEIIVYIALLILILNLHNILSVFLKTRIPLAVVTSSSMYPTLSIGDIVIVEGVEIEEIEVGDIIVFKPHSQGYPIIHRVVRIIEVNGKIIVKTKGDNNLTIDPWDVTEEMILGRVLEVNGIPFKIPFIGYLTLYLKGLHQLSSHR